MWFGLLTPGAHPARPAPTPEATVMCWTPRDRRKIDGPFAAAHGGMRVLRRQFHDQGLTPSAPRCFVCRQEWELPDPALRAVLPFEAPAPEDLEPAGGDEAMAGPRRTALLACVHLDPLAGAAETSLHEEVLVAVPGTPLALYLPLARVPELLDMLLHVVPDDPPPCCDRCGAVLPGGKEQRRVDEALHARAAAARRPRRGHGRRAA